MPERAHRADYAGLYMQRDVKVFVREPASQVAVISTEMFIGLVGRDSNRVVSIALVHLISTALPGHSKRLAEFTDEDFGDWKNRC